ncbi:MAG: Holliday junction branch migration protein RuvA [Desulfuromonadaceae bacterium]|nr:Holliday junction branch migration protein RuvA [Desulfuromonadaceae bacterium]
MIAMLTGELAHKSPDYIIICVQGVGYRVFLPLSSYYELPESGQVSLHIYTHVREEMLHLYGFLAPAEKEMFILLLTISGIGPKVALNILSHMSSQALQQALLNEDIKTLSTLPGIGKKTAERLILELREKVAKLAPMHRQQAASAQANGGPEPESISDDVLSALLSLGYKEKQARTVLAELKDLENATTENLLRAALQRLTR